MNDPEIVIMGAGKIGRSFIGQLFSRNGYRVVFVDVDKELVDELNRRGSYPVVIKAPDALERLIIKNVAAIHAADHARVTETISGTDLLAVSVGKNALGSVIPLIAEGLRLREQQSPGRVLDIILAENMRSVGPWFRRELDKRLPSDYPIDDRVGMVETSIGKMVPIMTVKDLEEDPLQVFAEPYNTLILDKKGFLGKIPEISELDLKDHMKAWVDRKAFIHNLGHAAAAYCGFYFLPEAVCLWEVLEDERVRGITRKVMQEAAEVLVAEYPAEFSMDGLTLHIHDLIARFRNRNLGDTVYRVGSDLRRKLGKGDRFLGIIRLARKQGKPYHTILTTMAMGFHFQARDEEGDLHPGDQEFHRLWNRNPDQVLSKICGMTSPEEEDLIREFKACYENVSRGSSAPGGNR